MYYTCLRFIVLSHQLKTLESIIDKLDDKEIRAFYSILDALIAKKRMKDTLSSAIGLAS